MYFYLFFTFLDGRSFWISVDILPRIFYIFIFSTNLSKISAVKLHRVLYNRANIYDWQFKVSQHFHSGIRISPWTSYRSYLNTAESRIRVTAGPCPELLFPAWSQISWAMQRVEFIFSGPDYPESLGVGSRRENSFFFLIDIKFYKVLWL